MEKIWYDHTSGEWSGDEYGYGQAASAAKAPEGGVCTLYSPVGESAFIFAQTAAGRDALTATSGSRYTAGELQSCAADMLAGRRRERGERVALPSELDLKLAVRAADLLLAGTKPVILCLPKGEDVAAANARAEGIASLTAHLFGKKYAERVGFLCFTEYFPSDLPSMRLREGELNIRFIVYYGTVDPSYDGAFAVIRPEDALPAPASRYLQAALSYLHDCGADYEANARRLVEAGESAKVCCGGKLRGLFEGGTYDEAADHYAAALACFSLRPGAESAVRLLKAYAEWGYAEESAVSSYAEKLRAALKALKGAAPDDGMLRCLYDMYCRKSCALHDEAGVALSDYCDVGQTGAETEAMLLRLADGIPEGSGRAAFLVLFGLTCFKNTLKDKERLARADERLAQIAARLPAADAFEHIFSWCLYRMYAAQARTDKRTRLRETPAPVLDGMLGGAEAEDVVAAVSASFEGAEGLSAKYLKAAERAAAFFGADVSACKGMLDADPALKGQVAARFYSPSVYASKAAKAAAALYEQRPYAELCREEAEELLTKREEKRRAAMDEAFVICSLRRQEFDRISEAFAAKGAGTPKHAASKDKKADVKERRQERSEQFLATVAAVCVAAILVLSALLLILPPAVYPDSFSGAFWENVLAYLREWPVSLFFPAMALIIFGVSVSVAVYDRGKRKKGEKGRLSAEMVEDRRREIERHGFLLFCVKATVFSVLPAIFYDLVWMIVYFIR